MGENHAAAVIALCDRTTTVQAFQEAEGTYVGHIGAGEMSHLYIMFLSKSCLPAVLLMSMFLTVSP